MKLALIGGNGHHYLKAAAADSSLDVQVVAVSGDGVDPGAAGKHMEAFPKAQWFDSPERMLDEARPDVVSVGAVYAHNGINAMLCLERNIPVASDKPVATTWEMLEKLRRTADASTAQLVTEFDFRARPAMASARKLVLDGAIGTPILATAQKSYPFAKRPDWYADRKMYGGTVLWVASHGIDALEFITGRRIERATGRSGNLSRESWPTFEDHTISLCELEGGTSGCVHADFLRSPKAGSWGDDRVRIAGSAGVIEVRDNRCMLEAMDAPPSDQTDMVRPEPLHRIMLDALLHGGNEQFSKALSLQSAATLLAARDGTDRGEWVRVPVIGDGPLERAG
ncbi:MAG: Gfo/Idh/MocA family oxidoreductase [Phycisphaeraceae bacterium]|nr:Gfo/Idh/MocA family oxidoreductase [Phycisphaeraceae bacterium]